MKILFACVLLMLLSATVLSGSKIQIRVQSSATVFPTNEADESRKLTLKQRYEKFKIQHIKKDMTENECGSELYKRKINKNQYRCKKINTFILADEQDVKDICKDQISGMVQSTQKFDIVVCELKKKESIKSKCNYQGERLTNRVVEVTCEGGFPVHYQGDKLNFAE
ncbi:Ribonuclease-like 3 [Channa argus]|uniref:Ribonuclease-like 3 n=1 Tax=Channa argus TaxID=215402 RepID=A0A6G1PE50_CHAAH|nr:Ribonuclease-like 3 [Channa argus]